MMVQKVINDKYDCAATMYQGIVKFLPYYSEIILHVLNLHLNAEYKTKESQISCLLITTFLTKNHMIFKKGGSKVSELHHRVAVKWPPMNGLGPNFAWKDLLRAYFDFWSS